MEEISRTQRSPHKHTICGRTNCTLHSFHDRNFDPLCIPHEYEESHLGILICHAPSPLVGIEASRDLTSSSRTSLKRSAMFRVNFVRIMSTWYESSKFNGFIVYCIWRNLKDRSECESSLSVLGSMPTSLAGTLNDRISSGAFLTSSISPGFEASTIQPRNVAILNRPCLDRV